MQPDRSSVECRVSGRAGMHTHAEGGDMHMETHNVDDGGTAYHGQAYTIIDSEEGCVTMKRFSVYFAAQRKRAGQKRWNGSCPARRR